jgi:hypothetical protein
MTASASHPISGCKCRLKPISSGDVFETPRCAGAVIVQRSKGYQQIWQKCG